MKKYLLLENGMIFPGQAFGAPGDAICEIVFATNMVGYVETLTNPGYKGQGVVQTFPLLGNYGVMEADMESSAIHAAAYIVREHCDAPSNFRAEGTLDAFLKKHNIPGLCGVDTRTLTRVLRDNGTMNGAIVDDPHSVSLADIAAYRPMGTVAAVSRKEKTVVNEGGKFRVALIDYGVRAAEVNELVKFGCEVTLFPHDVTSDEILAMAPDGLFLSGGPGDPVDNTQAIATLRELSRARIPTMAVGLGHQLLALAHGFYTEKLKFGHRGANHSVRDAQTGNLYLTTQSHGYVVSSRSIKPALAAEWLVNVNDGTNEGLEYKMEPAFSVQFHPEACGGPKDAGMLFKRFIELMEVCHAEK